jgi:hypothetical protein
MLVPIQEIETLPAEGKPVYGFCISRHARPAHDAAGLFREQIGALDGAAHRVAVYTRSAAGRAATRDAAPYEEILLNVMFEDRDDAQRFYRLLGGSA